MTAQNATRLSHTQALIWTSVTPATRKHQSNCFHTNTDICNLLITYRFGKEADDNGRVWKIYKDGVKQQDDGSFEAWKETLDVLLVFVSV